MIKTSGDTLEQANGEIQGPSPQIFRLKTSRGSMLKAIVKSIDSISEYPLIQSVPWNCDLDLRSNGQFRLHGMDYGRIVLFDFLIQNEFWDNKREFVDCEPVFLPFDVIQEWFKLSELKEPHIELVYVEGKISVELTADGEPVEFNEIAFDSSEVDAQYLAPLLETEIQFSNQIRLETSKFQKAIKLFPLGEKNKPKFEDIYFEFSETGLKMWGDVKKTKEHKEAKFSPYTDGFQCKEPGWCAFSNAYLHAMINLQPISPEVTIHHNVSAPGKFDFSIAEPVGKKGFADLLGEATFIIAPKVEEDDDIYEND